jgi:hypothetical protein
MAVPAGALQGENTVIERVDFDEDAELVVVQVRPAAREH